MNNKDTAVVQQLTHTFGYKLNKYRRALKLLPQLIKDLETELDEMDGDYEMGRGARPPGYDARRAQ